MKCFRITFSPDFGYRILDLMTVISISNFLSSILVYLYFGIYKIVFWNANRENEKPKTRIQNGSHKANFMRYTQTQRRNSKTFEKVYFMKKHPKYCEINGKIQLTSLRFAHTKGIIWNIKNGFVASCLFRCRFHE